jgi:hypothetical protein
MKRREQRNLIVLAAVLLGPLAGMAHAGTVTITPADNIQAKSDAAAAGDTILFTPGTYKPTAQIRTKANVTYQGQPGAVIYTRFADNAFRVTGNNVTIRGLTFDGAGIRIDGGGSNQVKNLTIDNCKFAVRRIAQTAWTGIIFENAGGPLVDSKITNCTMDPIEGDCGIYGYTYRNLTIANNQFLNGQKGGDAIHIIAHDNASTGLLIEQNFFSGIHRMAVELQGGNIGPVIQDNWYENPFMLGQFSGNNDTFCWSAINADGRDLKLLRNVSITPTSAQSPDGVGVRIIMELGGQNVLAEHNYSRGGNHIIAGNGSRGTGIARNNNIDGYREGPRNSNENKTTYSNNGPGVALPYDPIARGRPFPNQRYGQSLPQELPPAPDHTPPGDVIPPIDPPPTADVLSRLSALEARMATAEGAITQTREDATRANGRLDKIIEAGK